MPSFLRGSPDDVVRLPKVGGLSSRMCTGALLEFLEWTPNKDMLKRFVHMLFNEERIEEMKTGKNSA
jgi:hypothetical protein